MNWLAHLYLSEPSVEFRLGGLLPDLLPMSGWKGLSGDLLRGAQCHRLIDAYTDSHPVVRRSIARIEPPFRRYAGIFVDVFYDHLLARGWEVYANLSFAAFEKEIYTAIDHAGPAVPSEALQRLSGMRRHRWLQAYRSLEGIERTLESIGRRLRRPQALGSGVVCLEQNQAGFAEDFAEFFPQLASKVREEYAIAQTVPAI